MGELNEPDAAKAEAGSNYKYAHSTRLGMARIFKGDVQTPVQKGLPAKAVKWFEGCVFSLVSLNARRFAKSGFTRNV